MKLFKIKKNIYAKEFSFVFTKRNFVILLFFSFGNTLFSQSNYDTINHIKESTVFLKLKHNFILSEEETEVSGSGFFVSPKGIIVTNYHVIQSFMDEYNFYYPTVVSEIKVITNSGTQNYKSYKALILSIDKENDLAILKIKDTITTPYIDIDYDENLVESAPISVYGYPLGEEFSVLQRGPEITLSKGFITSLRHNDLDKLSKIQIDAVVKKGNSGGPLINKKWKALGVVNLIYGSGMNFAVPVSYLKSMLDSIPENFNYTDSITVNLTSSVPSAVFVDGKHIGITPALVKVLPGVHKIYFLKQGYQNCIIEKSVLQNTSVNGIMNQVIPIVITNSNVTKEENIIPFKYEVSNTLLKEDFNKQSEFDKWKQNTGGESKRTWFIEDGILNQFESDELLHAISLGDSTWNNYEIKTKIKITDKHDDSRAGVIFRETNNGFYLFRIHKESKMAQLAYHSKNPFGWFVLKEKSFDKDISNDWFSVKVVVYGNYISCYLDSVCIFSAIAEYIPDGKIGLYSVQSKASFDSLEVNKINIIESKANLIKTTEPLSFWLTDYFNQGSTFWYPYNSNGLPSPFEITDAGFVQSFPENNTKYCELTKFKLSDFVAQYLISFSEKDTNACFELFFRKDYKNSLSIKFSAKDNKVYLLQKNENTIKILSENSLPAYFFNDKLPPISLTINKNSIKCNSYNNTYIDYKSNKIITTPGYTGFSISNTKTIIHQFRMYSLKESDVINKK